MSLNRWISKLTAVFIATLTLTLVAVVELFGVALCAGQLSATWTRGAQLALLSVGMSTSLLAAIAMHELGHLAAGAAVGFPPLLAHVGPLTWKRVGVRWRLIWDRRQSWLLARALVVDRDAGRGARLVLALGGCAANLAAAAVCILLVGCLPPSGRTLVGLLALHSLIAGVANLVPLRILGLDSDGLCVLRLLTSREVVRFNWHPMWGDCPNRPGT